VPATLAWPHAAGSTVDTGLADGTAYQPRFFVDAVTSVGTAPDPEGRTMRLLLRGVDSSLRELRSRPLAEAPSFGNFTITGDDLAWVEGTNGASLQLWTVNLRDGQPARPVTTDTGPAVFGGSQHDLVIADGRLYWVAANPGRRDVTEVRSVALAGGPVDFRTEPGAWELSTWPWLVNGPGDPDGATSLRNLLTNGHLAVATSPRHTARCGPTWCQVLSTVDGGYRVELMHPDGSARETVSSGDASPAIAAVVPLDRFVVLAQADTYSGLTGTKHLLVFELATRRTVEVSPAARTVSYTGGVLWWSTGTQAAPVWHALDLRTV
jgi:hypothetical protein